MSGINTFTFNGTVSSVYGIYVSDKNVYAGAARDVAEIKIPGRSGNLVIDNERFENFPLKYDCFLVPATAYDDLAKLSRAVKGWLLGGFGYKTLTDTYNPGYYRLASFANTLDIAEVMRQVGKVPMTFNCKPFLYASSGLNTIELTTAETIYNFEALPSLPYIKITGSGTIDLAIGSKTYHLTSVSSYIEIDSEIMNVFKGSTSCNSKMTSDGFPVLVPGENNISWTGTVSKVEIIPRWCTL